MSNYALTRRLIYFSLISFSIKIHGTRVMCKSDFLNISSFLIQASLTVIFLSCLGNFRLRLSQNLYWVSNTRKCDSCPCKLAVTKIYKCGIYSRMWLLLVFLGYMTLLPMYAAGQYVTFWQFAPLKPCCILNNSLISGIKSVFPDLLTVL